MTDEEIKASRDLKTVPKVTQVKRGGARIPGLGTGQTCPSTNEWLGCGGELFGEGEALVEYYSASKRKEILTPAAMCEP